MLPNFFIYVLQGAYIHIQTCVGQNWMDNKIKNLKGMQKKSIKRGNVYV